MSIYKLHDARSMGIQESPRELVSKHVNCGEFVLVGQGKNTVKECGGHECLRCYEQVLGQMLSG